MQYFKKDIRRKGKPRFTTLRYNLQYDYEVSSRGFFIKVRSELSNRGHESHHDSNELDHGTSESRQP